MSVYVDIVQSMYIAYYGRPADPNGLKYWCDRLEGVNGNLNEMVNAFGNSEEANSLFGSSSAEEKVDAIYIQLFGRHAEPEGLMFYVNALMTGKMSQASVMLDVLNGAQNEDKTIVENKLEVAKAFTDNLSDNTIEMLAYSGMGAANIARDMLDGVDADANTMAQAVSDVQFYINKMVNGATRGADLTANTDEIGANYFSAGQVYTPGENDRVNSLQDEDYLVGLGPNPTLNVTLGNPGDNGDTVITPKMDGVETVNAAFTSSTHIMALDLQDSPDVGTVNITRISGISGLTNGAVINNMQKDASVVGIYDTATKADFVELDFSSKALDGDYNTMSLVMQSAEVGNISIGELDENAPTDVLERLAIDAEGGVAGSHTNDSSIDALQVNGLKEMMIKGNANLTIGDLVGMDGTLQYVDVRPFTGTLNLADAAINLVLADDASLQGKLNIDGGNSASDVLEIFNTADISAADLAGLKNFNEIKFSSGDQTDEQVLTLVLTDAILAAFGDNDFTVSFGGGSAPKKIILDLSGVTAGMYNIHLPADNVEAYDPNGVLNPITSSAVFSIADLTIAEDGATASVVISRDVADAAADVVFHSVDGSATSPADYTGVSGTIHFDATELSKTVSIAIIDDAVVEPSETFSVVIDSVSVGTIGDGSATVTITDNDTPVSNPVFNITNATTVAEDAGTVLVATITRDDASAAASLTVTVAGDTATAGADFFGGTATANFAAGESTHEIRVEIVNDTLVEGNETFTVAISNPSIGTIGNGTTVVTITDNDVAENLVVLGIAGANASVTANAAQDEIFTFDAVGAMATADNTQVILSGFDVAHDSLRIDLATADAAIVNLSQLGSVAGLSVQANPITNSTLINFGPDLNGDVITVELQGITDSAAVNIAIV